jgi:hypothetical protein
VKHLRSHSPSLARLASVASPGYCRSRGYLSEPPGCRKATSSEELLYLAAIAFNNN